MGSYSNLLRTPPFFLDGIRDEEDQIGDLAPVEPNYPQAGGPYAAAASPSYQAIPMPYLGGGNAPNDSYQQIPMPYLRGGRDIYSSAMNGTDPLKETHAYEDLIHQQMDRKPAPLWRQIVGGIVGSYIPPAGSAIADPGGAELRHKIGYQAQLSKEELNALQKQAQWENIQSEIAQRGALNAQRDYTRQQQAAAGDLARQNELDRFVQNGGQFVSPDDRQQTTQIEPLQSPEAPAPTPESAQGPALPTPNTLLPLSRKRQLPVTAQIPAVPGGYMQVPGEAPAGQVRIQPTMVEAARQKKAAEQENWLPTPAPIMDKFPGAPQRMPKDLLETYIRLIESGDKAQADREFRQFTMDQNNQLRRDLADQSDRTRRDLGAAGNADKEAAALDRETTRFAKPHEKSIADASAQLEKIADARSMINGNAEAQALGIPKILTALVSGPSTGVRITTPELNAIAHARGVMGDVQGFFNKAAGQGTLTKQQQQQMTQMLDDVRDRLMQKQALAHDALDQINSARSRDEVIRIDKEVRQKLADFEKVNQQGGASGSVKLQAPDGSIRDVPAGEAAHYISLGAKKI